MRRSVRCVLFSVLVLILAYPVFAQVAISVSFGPPALPVYEQPLCPAEGYVWTPGYWAYDPDYGYYWVPGTWVLAPEVGYLWTPPWWGWEGSAYSFHEGYWGPQVGFYGGINYGYGYFGHGFEGGRWQGNSFYYNRSVMNVNVTNIRNVYNTTVINRGGENRVSYNGGSGGLTARPSPAEEAAERGRHIPPIAAQTEHRQQAHGNPELRASANQGKPPIAATEKPAAFSGHGVVPAREAGAPYHPPANARETRPVANGAENRPAAPTHASEPPPHPSEPPQHEVNPPVSSGNTRMEDKKQKEHVTNEHPAEAPRPAAPPTHASELPKHQVTAPSSTGNPKVDQKYQQQQEKLVAKQNQQHQKLQQQQEKEDQRATQQNYQAEQHQQIEQRHQQQTTHMEQQHTQQTEHLQKQQAGHAGGRPQ